MRNARARFALDENGTVFDYVTSQNHAPHGALRVACGEWDLAKVAELIHLGEHIEGAYTPLAAVEGDKVEQAKQDFLNAPIEQEAVTSEDAGSFDEMLGDVIELETPETTEEAVQPEAEAAETTEEIEQPKTVVSDPQPE